jgi:hypothetical protein
MDINPNINTLLNELQPIHKIYLNDDMYLIKLHNNKIFKKWLNSKNIMPKFKPYHTLGWRTYLDKQGQTGEDIWPQFITIGIIASNKNNNKPDYKSPETQFICCQTIVKLIANNLFNNKEESSGFGFNGSFFFMSQHVDRNKYGSLKHYNEYGVNNSNELVNKQIGYYRHNYEYNKFSNKNIIPITKNNDKGTNFPIDFDISGPNYDDVKESLFWIRDKIGILLVNKKNEYSIKTYDEYQDYKNNGIPSSDQLLLGNLLISNNNIVMNESLLGEVICINVVGVPKGTRGILCKNSRGELYLPEEYSNIGLSQLIFIKLPDERIIESYYSPKYIIMPFNISLITKENPYEFAGAIPPAMPMHACDINPRTCVMIDQNDNVMVMMVEGRYTECGGRGIDLFDLAKLCKELGAKHAINLDGGGSSSLYWKEKGVTVDYTEKENNKTVGNAIFVIGK